MEEEIKKWKERVFYPQEEFKKDTKADLDLLRKFLERAKDDFVVICSSSESSVYKIGRFMIENGISNEDITFQDSSIFDVYIDPNTRYDYQYRELCAEMCMNLKQKVAKKWLIVPYVDAVWNKKVALYFVNELDRIGCYGLLFYSPDTISGNLAQALCESSYSDNYIQFPKIRYLNEHKEKPLEDDGF